MVTKLQKDFTNPDGIIETMIITSDDNYTIDLSKRYKLANYTSKKQNKIVNAFKNSILGAEIGIKAEGFSNIAILATIIAVGLFCMMFILFRI